MTEPRALTDEEVFGTKPLTDAELMATPQNRGARAPAPLPARPAPPRYGAPMEDAYAYTDLGLPIGSGTGAGAAGDPNSTFATAGRALSSVPTALPDLANQIHNAGARAAGQPEVPLWQPQLNRIMGVPEMDPKAGLGRQLGEAGLAALLGGGGAAAGKALLSAPSWAASILPTLRKLVSTTVAPTVASEAGAVGGESLAKYLKLDPQTGALAGGLLGGSAAGRAPTAIDQYRHNWYARHADPNAPAIATAMERMGSVATPGMLGDNVIQDMERQIGSSIGGKQQYMGVRDAAIDAIGNTLNQVADRRGQANDPTAPPVADPSGVPPRYGGPRQSNVATPLPSTTTPNAADITPGTIGERLASAARETAEAIRERSDASQATLLDRVGAQTPVELRGLQGAGAQLMAPGSGVEPSMKANLAQRLGPALEAMLFRRNDDRNNPALLFRNGQPAQNPVDPYGPRPGEPPRPSPVNRGAFQQPPAAPIPPMTATEAMDRYRGATAPPDVGAPAPQPLPAAGAAELTRGIGDNGGPPMQLDRQGFVDRGSVAAPYADVRAYRTELGRDVDMPTGQRLGPAAVLYGPTTDAMRTTAERQGVSRQDFENAMARTQDVETRPKLPEDPTGDYRYLMDIAAKKELPAYQFLEQATQNASDMGRLEATQHPQFGGIMGDLIKYLGRETVNNPNEGAAGPRQIASGLENLNPQSRSIMYGDQGPPQPIGKPASAVGPFRPQEQLPGMEDVALAARAYNYPTSQTGVHRAVGGAADRTMLGVLGANALDHLGGIGAALASLGLMPGITMGRSAALHGPIATNAMRGSQAPAQSIAELAAALSAAETASQERSIVRRPGR